jgi:hypothetical protein
MQSDVDTVPRIQPTQPVVVDQSKAVTDMTPKKTDSKAASSPSTTGDVNTNTGKPM